METVRLSGVGCSVPPVELASDEFFERIASRCRESMLGMLSALGVRRRYSVLADPCAYILGEQPQRLLGCFHPSQQNTFTGVLTESMTDVVMLRAREMAGLTGTGA